jgi:hypothetical protein
MGNVFVNLNFFLFGSHTAQKVLKDERCFISCLVEVRDEVPLRRVFRVLVGSHVDVEVDLDKVIISKHLKQFIHSLFIHLINVYHSSDIRWNRS